MGWEMCPKCHGKGKIGIEEPVSQESMEFVEKDCDLCGGTGFIEKDLTPQVIERLDKIIELLTAIRMWR